MANFEVFRWVISSSINLLFLKSGAEQYIPRLKNIYFYKINCSQIIFCNFCINSRSPWNAVASRNLKIEDENEVSSMSVPSEFGPFLKNIQFILQLQKYIFFYIILIKHKLKISCFLFSLHSCLEKKNPHSGFTLEFWHEKLICVLFH